MLHKALNLNPTVTHLEVGDGLLLQRPMRGTYHIKYLSSAAAVTAATTILQ